VTPGDQRLVNAAAHGTADLYASFWTSPGGGCAQIS